MVQEPPVFICLGKAGDIILFLPALKAIQERTGVNPKVIVSTQYSSVLDGVGYVDPIVFGNDFMDVPGAVAFAKERFGDPVIPAWWHDRNHVPEQAPGGIVLRVHGNQWAVDQSKYPGFMQSMYLRAGFTLGEMMELPLIFDRRDMLREQNLIRSFMGAKSKPILLLNFNGEASPFPMVPEVMRYLDQFRNRLNIIRLDNFRAHRIYDLLGLMDKAIGMITVDTATLHLAQGSKTPYISFTRDGWSGSVPRGNCSLNIKYSTTIQRAAEIPQIIEGWMKGETVVVNGNGKPHRSCWFLERQKVNLKNVVLWGCCWSQDQHMYRQTIRVLRYCEKLFEFQKIYFLTYMDPPPDCEFSVVRVPQMNMPAWNIFVNKTVPLIIKEGDYVMSVHEDGFPIRPNLWRKEFLDYDYIGAPWNDGVVGNGGFNIESRKLMEEKLKLPDDTTQPSDNYVCRVHRTNLESKGIRFAPIDVAVEFSTEMTGSKWPSFGFHGRTWQPMKYQEGWTKICQLENES